MLTSNACLFSSPSLLNQLRFNRDMSNYLGAEIIRTPTEAPHDSPESNLGRAESLLKEIPDSVMLNQYGNPNSTHQFLSLTLGLIMPPSKLKNEGADENFPSSRSPCQQKKTDPDAHYYTTAPEIISDLSSASSPTTHSSTNLCNVLVAGAGTGGTLTGLSRRLKESNPDCVIVGVDPMGSILARPEGLNTLAEGESDLYEVEGIGYDFVSLSAHFPIMSSLE